MPETSNNKAQKTIMGLPAKFAYILFAIVTLYAISKGLKHKQVSDFYTLWDAGRNFWLGGDLYFREGLRPFSYPPFSAFILSIFTFPFLPSKAAAITFGIVEAALMVGCIGLSAAIIRDALNKTVGTGVLLLTLFFTAAFFINTINLLQVNLILLLFTLLFIRLYIRGSNVMSAMFLALAIMFKILPGLFVVWLVFRGRLKALLWTLGFLGLFTLSVLAIRGPEQGIKDHLQFKQNLSKYTQSSTGETVKLSKSISLRALALETMEEHSIKVSQSLILNSITLLCFALYVLWLIILRKRGLPPLPDLLGTLIVIPIMATTTESHHMVMIFPPLLYLLITLKDRADMKLWYRGLVGASLVVALCSKDVVGKEAVYWLGSHGLYALHPVIILAVLIALSLTIKAKDSAEKG